MDATVYLLTHWRASWLPPKLWYLKAAALRGHEQVWSERSLQLVWVSNWHIMVRLDLVKLSWPQSKALKLMHGCSNHAFFSLVAVPLARRSFLLLCFLIHRTWLMTTPVSKACWEHEIVFCMKEAKAWYCYIEVSKAGICRYNNRGYWEKRHWYQAMLDSDQALDQRLCSQMRFTEVRRWPWDQRGKIWVMWLGSLGMPG